jgi:hypothetical protein
VITTAETPAVELAHATLALAAEATDRVVRLDVMSGAASGSGLLSAELNSVGARRRCHLRPEHLESISQECFGSPKVVVNEPELALARTWSRAFKAPFLWIYFNDSYNAAAGVLFEDGQPASHEIDGWMGESIRLVDGVRGIATFSPNAVIARMAGRIGLKLEYAEELFEIFYGPESPVTSLFVRRDGQVLDSPQPADELKNDGVRA